MTEPGRALLAFLVAGALNLVILWRIRAGAAGSEGRFLARLFLCTLALRYALAVFLNLYASDSQFAITFWGDSETYDYGGNLLALSWSGESLVNPHVSRAISGFGFHYFVGALYYLFGRNQLLVQLVNGTIGALSVLVIYAIARALFEERVARWAGLFMAFFPQMIFWSAAMYKDPAILLCISVAMYAVLRLRERFTAAHVLLFVAASLALLTLRFYVFYIVAIATLGTFLFSQRRGAFGNIVTQLSLVLVFLSAIFLAVKEETLKKQTSYFDWKQIQLARTDQAVWGKSAYAEKVDVSTPAGAVAALPLGLAYLLFAPFPWAIRGLRQMLTLPETLVWYALMPALLRGLLHTVRHRLRECLPILVFAAMLTTAYAIFQSNVGTAYRQRTQITMFFFVFIGVGLVERAKRRAIGEPARPAALAP